MSGFATSDALLPVHAIVLAAGRSSRMNGPNKLLAVFDGVPLVRRVTQAVIGSGVSSVCVVTGHDRNRVEQSLQGLAVSCVDNPDHAAGMSRSLRAGMSAVPASAAGAMIVLGDMPDISSTQMRLLLERFTNEGGNAIVRAASGGRSGNPVVLPRALFAELMTLQGDTGARSLIGASALAVIDVDIGDGALLDVDTPEALASAGGRLDG